MIRWSDDGGAATMRRGTGMMTNDEGDERDATVADDASQSDDDSASTMRRGGVLGAGGEGGVGEALVVGVEEMDARMR